MTNYFSRSLRFRPLRFLLGGGWNAIFSFLLFSGLYFLFQEIVHYLWIHLFCAVISVTNAFICHRFFVFQSKGVWWREYLRFYLVYGVQIFITFFGLILCIDGLEWNAYFSRAILLMVSVLTSYLGHKHFSFRELSQPSKPSEAKTEISE